MNIFVLATVIATTGVAFADVTGSYTGQLRLARPSRDVVMAAALSEAAGTIRGTVVLGTTDAALDGAYVVGGRLKGSRVRLTGTNAAGARLVLRAVVRAAIVSGRARVHSGRARAKGRLTMSRLVARGDGSACDAVFTRNASFFTTQVMDGVLVPVCAACHVAGGQAEAARLRVTRGDPAATARTTVLVIDASNPTGSLLLAKPLGAAPHGGGQRIAAGSSEAQILEQWIALVTQAACTSTPAGGGTGADLYAAKCAGCHGADGAGLAGRTDVRCTVRSLLVDAVRHGRGAGTTGMPAFGTAELPDAGLGLIEDHLRGLCSGLGKDVYASNCASCHGSTAGGGVNADGVAGPNIRCSEAGDLGEALRGGSEGMPSFASITGATRMRLANYVRGLCALGGGGGD